MQRSLYHRHWSGCEIIATLLALALCVIPARGLAQGQNAAKALPFPKNLTAQNSPAAAALATAPITIRNVLINAEAPMALYFAARPGLAMRLINGEGQRAGSLEQDDETGLFSFSPPSGAVYTLIKHKTGGHGFFHVTFNYFHEAGVGIKLSGAGAMTVKISPGPERDMARLDYDIYFAPGGFPLDNIAANAGAQAIMIAEDMEKLAAAFTGMCESAAFDPAQFAAEMLDDPEIFHSKEVEDFKRRFVAKKR